MLIGCGSSATDGFSVSSPNYVIIRNNYFFMKTWPAKEIVRNKQTQSDLSVIYEVPGLKLTTPPSGPLERNTNGTPWRNR